MMRGGKGRLIDRMAIARWCMLFGAVVLAAGCGGKSGDADTLRQNAAPAARPASASPENAAPEAPTLTAESLPGTVWSAGPLKLAFEKDGKLLVNGSEPGEWTFDAGQVTVKAGDISYIVTVRGGRLFYGDMELAKSI